MAKSLGGEIDEMRYVTRLAQPEYSEYSVNTGYVNLITNASDTTKAEKKIFTFWYY